MVKFNLILLVLAIPNVISSDSYWNEAPYCRTVNNSTTEWKCINYRNFPPDFDNASTVEKLELIGNRYEWHPTLEKLTSKHLQLYKLPNLVELVLEEDQFDEIEPGAFRNAGKLVKLTLRWNEMEKLDLQVFTDVPNLQKLQINDAFLPGSEDFEDWEFPKLGNLTELALESLKISSLKPNMFKNLKSLQTLDLFTNKLTTLDDREVFRPLTNLKVLRIPFNSIRFMDPEVFADLQNLEILDLYENNLHKGFKTGTQFHNRNLIALNLFNCQLKYIEEELFANLGKLKELLLANNRLSHIPPKTFSSLKNLEALWLNNNQIKTLEPSVFSGLGNLRGLDLAGNQLQSLDWKVLRDLKSLARIGLHENPWQCDCQVLYLQKFLKQRNIKYKHIIEDPMEIFIPRCKTFGEKGEPVPNDTREGPEWKDLSSEQLDCLAFPNITKLSADKQPKLGESITLQCEFIGDLPLQVVWMRGDVILRNSTLSEKVPLHNGTLKEYNDQLNILNFKEEDAGLYKVIVSNEAGESEKTLDVIGEPSTLNSAGNAKQSFLLFFQCYLQIMLL